MMDWLATNRTDRFEYEMLDPRSMSQRGWLKNIVSASISENYEADLRVSGKLEAVDSGYISGSLIRIHHYVDAWNYHAVLGTFFATFDPKRSMRTDIQSFDLTSMLSRIDADCFEANYAYGSEAGSAIVGRMLESWNVPYRIMPDCSDCLTVGATAYTAGTAKIDALYEVADAMGARVELDGDGTVVLSKHVSPASREPEWTISEDNGTISGDVSITCPDAGNYNRVIATFKSGDADMAAHADLPSTHALSYAQTGRVVAKVVNVSELNPQTSAALLEYAQEQADELMAAKRKYSFAMIYLPLKCGHTVMLKIGGETCKAMLLSRDMDLCAGFPCSVTFKEV